MYEQQRMNKKENFHIKGGKTTVRLARVGILSGLVIYMLFGVIDPFLLPENYQTVWYIRFLFVGPLILIGYLHTFGKKFLNYGAMIMQLILFCAELGILAMIYIATPNEGAFLAYYAGLILIILWSGFIFRFSVNVSLFYFIFTVVVFNAIMVFHHQIFSYHLQSIEFGVYIGNNFFLFATGVLSLVGIRHLDNYYAELQTSNNQLLNDKQTLLELKNKAEESDRLKSSFLANMNHEIRTPLNGIIGFSEIIRNDKITETERSDYLKIISDSSMQLMQIVNQIIDLSKLDTNQITINPTTRDIRMIIHHLYKIFEKHATFKSIKLIADYPKETPCFVNTDHTRLTQIISNLLDNAMKFTQKDGEIRFGYYQNHNDELVFFVKDTGIGIPEKYHSIIFERFRQLEISHTRTFRGNGLGLAICKDLAALLDGEISVESVVGQGSKFYLSLKQPCTADLKNLGMEETQCAKISLLKDKHILLAEDEKNNFQLINALLKHTDVKLTHVSDGQKAYELILEGQTFDLVLMDIKMPNLDGYESQSKIREICPDLPIIAQTAYVMAEDKQDVLNAGFTDFLPKPIDPFAFYNIIEKYLS
jgi:signal transduction histidine kinase/CheY-like chemotaxis protein